MNNKAMTKISKSIDIQINLIARWGKEIPRMDSRLGRLSRTNESKAVLYEGWVCGRDHRCRYVRGLSESRKLSHEDRASRWKQNPQPGQPSANPL